MNRYLIPAFLVIVAVGIGVMYIDPLYANISAGKAKIVEYDNLLADAKTASDKIERLKEIQERFPSGYDRSLATILPASIDPLRLVIDINGIAALRGLHVKGPSVTTDSSSKKDAGGVRKNTLTFSISAPYPVFREFLRDLESNLALQDLSQLNFSSEMSAETTSNIANIRPELRIYDYQVNVITYSLPK